MVYTGKSYEHGWWFGGTPSLGTPPKNVSFLARHKKIQWVFHWLHTCISGWWFGTFFYFPIYWVSNHPNWLSYFSEGLKPPTRYDDVWYIFLPENRRHGYPGFQRIEHDWTVGQMVIFIWAMVKLVDHGDESIGCWLTLINSLVGGLVAIFIFPYIGFLIIPTDELIFFRGVAQPPTR